MMHISFLGEAVRHIFSHREDYLHRDITLVTDRHTVGEVAQIMNKHLQPLGQTIENAQVMAHLSSAQSQNECQFHIIFAMKNSH